MSGAAGAAGDHAARNMALMFGAVSWFVTVASGWVVKSDPRRPRRLALAFFALVGLSLLSQRVAQRPPHPPW